MGFQSSVQGHCPKVFPSRQLGGVLKQFPNTCLYFAYCLEGVHTAPPHFCTQTTCIPRLARLVLSVPFLGLHLEIRPVLSTSLSPTCDSAILACLLVPSSIISISCLLLHNAARDFLQNPVNQLPDPALRVFYPISSCWRGLAAAFSLRPLFMLLQILECSPIQSRASPWTQVKGPMKSNHS